MPNEELEKKVAEYEESLATNKKRDKKSLVKYIINITLVLTGTVLAIFFSLKDDFHSVISYLAKSDLTFIFITIGIMFAISCLKALVYFCFARLYTRDYKYHQGLVIDQVGIFYNAVTPGASGGQIMQAYTFKRQGLPISNAVSIMAMYSIVFQTVLIVYGMVAFFVEFDTIIRIGSINILGFDISIIVLTIIGFLLNVSVIGIVLLMGYWKGFHNFVMGPCVRFLHKIRLCKNPDKVREDLRVQVENFKIELRRLLTNVPILVLVTFLVFAAMTLKFSVPYFVGIALGNESTVDSFWSSVMLCNYHQMVTGCIPIPGSAGVSELVFKQLFLDPNNIVNSFFVSTKGSNVVDSSTALCMAALLVWRSITFTIPLIIAGIVSAFYKPRKRHAANEIKPDPLSRNTLVSLQRETFVERLEEVEKLEQTSELTLDAIRKRLKALNKKQKQVNKVNDDYSNVDQDKFDHVDIDNGDDSI